MNNLAVVTKVLNWCNLALSICLLATICVLYAVMNFKDVSSSILSLDWPAFIFALTLVSIGIIFVASSQVRRDQFEWFAYSFVSCGLNTYGLGVYILYQFSILYFAPVFRTLISGLSTCIETIHVLLLHNYSNSSLYMEIFGARLVFASVNFVDQLTQYLVATQFMVDYNTRSTYVLLEVLLVYSVLIVGASLALGSWAIPTMGIVVYVSWIISAVRMDTEAALLVLLSVVSTMLIIAAAGFATVSAIKHCSKDTDTEQNNLSNQLAAH